jgi:cobalamin synthase
MGTNPEHAMIRTRQTFGGLSGGAAAAATLLLIAATLPAAAQHRREPLLIVPTAVAVPHAGLAGPLDARPADPRTDTTGTSMVNSEQGRGRNDAMLNGALIALGTLGVFDNVVIHWILGWHRAIEGSPYSLEIEIGIVAVSSAMLIAGVVRERRTRRAAAAAGGGS